MPHSSEQTSDDDVLRLPRSRHAQRALALLSALAIAVSATACGSGDDNNGDGGSGSADTAEQEPLDTNAYLDQVNAAQTAFATAAAKLNLANPASAKAFGKSLGQLTGLIDTLRRQLAQITPPEDVAAQHDKLVEELGDYRETIAEEKGALTSGDAQEQVAAAQKVGKASTAFSQEFDATIKQINDNLGLESGTDSGQ
jgi:hypothetical protein